MIKSDNQNIKYIKTNVVPALSNWFIDSSGSYTPGVGITLNTGGICSCGYTSAGLKASKYRKFIIELGSSSMLTQLNNYQNIIDLVENQECVDSNNERTEMRNIIPVTLKGIKNNVVTIEVSELNQKVDRYDDNIMIKNRSNSDIVIKSVTVYRSNDVEGQASDMSSLIDTSGGMEVNNNNQLIYLVPTMSLADWNASSKTDFNEAIIVG